MSSDHSVAEGDSTRWTIQPDKKAFTPFEFYRRNEQMVREAQIANQTAQLLREELAHCVRTEGVNSNVECFELRKKYFDLLRDRYQGMLFPVGAEPANRAHPQVIYIPPTATEN
jgi:hypothetical protein